MKYKNIVILTGAGISEESGIQTFRGANGLWENYRIEDVASPEAFRRDPDLVHRFYNLRRQQLQSATVVPNAAHLAIKALEDLSYAHFLLVTQNVDNLHERAGCEKVVHMHGELLKIRCEKCGKIFEHHGDLSPTDICRHCHQQGSLRPDIVWFGEMPKHLDEIYAHLKLCDLFICIGTSGVVYPAANFVELVPLDCRKVEINMVATAISDKFDEHYFGKASEVVPKFIASLAED